MPVDQVISILGGRKCIKKDIHNRMELLSLAKEGISTRALGAIKANTSLSSQEIVSALPVSPSTLCRQTKRKRFDPAISEKFIEIAEFWSRGLEVFGNSERFQIWLHNPCLALGGIAPITLIDSSIGIGILQDELGRIEHGILA